VNEGRREDGIDSKTTIRKTRKTKGKTRVRRYSGHSQGVPVFNSFLSKALQNKERRGKAKKGKKNAIS